MKRDEWIKQLNLSGVGIEIGVQEGKFSKVILENSSIYLYLLDAWRHFKTDYTDSANVRTSTHIKNMANTAENLKQFDGRFTMIRDTSENGANLFKDEFFDFVYIDANHSYESCKRDLELWYPKVKKGGIISGHDYITMLPWIDVKRAVDDFFNSNNFKVETTDSEKFCSFYLVK